MSDLLTVPRYVALAALVALLVAGCGTSSEVMDLEEQVGGPVLTTSIHVPQGSITFYRYVKDEKCGAGVVYRIDGQRGHNRSGGGGPCTNATNSSALTKNAMRHYQGTQFVLLHGEVKDDRIAKVMVTIGEDKEARQADMLYGFWYVYIPGASEMPTFTIKGLDKDGLEVTPSE